MRAFTAFAASATEITHRSYRLADAEQEQWNGQNVERWPALERSGVLQAQRGDRCGKQNRVVQQSHLPVGFQHLEGCHQRDGRQNAKSDQCPDEKAAVGHIDLMREDAIQEMKNAPCK